MTQKERPLITSLEGSSRRTPHSSAGQPGVGGRDAARRLRSSGTGQRTPQSIRVSPGEQ